MLQGPPKEKQWVSWLFVIIWSLIIFVTIPVARAIQNFVAQQWSRTAAFSHLAAPGFDLATGRPLPAHADARLPGLYAVERAGNNRAAVRHRKNQRDD